MQEKAKKRRNFSNKRAEADSKYKQPICPINSIFNLKNKDNQNCGEILDDKNIDNRLSFDTPLPPA